MDGNINNELIITRKNNGLISFLFFLVFALLQSVISSAQIWSFHTVNQGVKPSIEVDQEGNAHIAYMLEALPGFVKHSEWKSTFFDATLVAAGYFYGPLDIGIDSSGQPHIVFHNHDDLDLNHYRRVSVNNWEKTGVNNPGHDGWDASITFDQDQNPHVSSVDPSGFGGVGIEYAYYNFDTWEVEAIGSASIMYANATSIALDSQNKPHITYFDDIVQDLIYTTKLSGSWNFETVDQAGDVGRFSSLVLDDLDIPHISYFQLIDNETGIVKYAYRDDPNWVISVIDTLHFIELGFAGARNVTSLQKDQNGNLILAYGDKKVIRLAMLTEGEWFIETVLDLSQTNTVLGQQVSLAVDLNNIPHLTYFEVTNTSPLEGVIKYAVKAEVVTGFEEELQELPNPYITIYPNPASDRLIVEILPIRTGDLQMILMDWNGKALKHWEIGLNVMTISIETGDIPDGIYIILLKSEEGVNYRKLIIQK